jgi:hypothetical protein
MPAYPCSLIRKTPLITAMHLPVPINTPFVLLFHQQVTKMPVLRHMEALHADHIGALGDMI